MKNDQIHKTILLMTYDGASLILRFAPPGHTIAYKNVDNLLKNCKYKFSFVM